MFQNTFELFDSPIFSHILYGGYGYIIVAVAQSGIHPFVYPSINQTSLNSSIHEWDHKAELTLKKEIRMHFQIGFRSDSVSSSEGAANSKTRFRDLKSIS